MDLISVAVKWGSMAMDSTAVVSQFVFYPLSINFIDRWNICSTTIV